MRLMLPVLACALFAAGCSAKPEPEASDAATGSAPAVTPEMPAPAAAASATAPAGGARAVKEENDVYDFEYSYPFEAGAIGDLRAWLDAQIVKERSELIANAKEQQADSKKEGYSYNALGDWIEWKVVTDLPGWLSLSAEVSSYEGGAHPNHGFDALLWDKQANVRRGAIDLFTSKQALSQAIRQDFCDALDKQRAAKREQPVNRASGDEFDKCIDPVDSTVILGSSDRKAFDRLGVLVAPYEAGSYAEGDYQVTLPVTAAIVAAVKPEYRASFAVKR